MYRYGLLEEGQNQLDYVLALLPADFLERRLQTLVFKLGLAKSIHHARVLIRQRHIRCVMRRMKGSNHASQAASLHIKGSPQHHHATAAVIGSQRQQAYIRLQSSCHCTALLGC